MRRKQLAKSVAVAVLSATMALSTGLPVMAAVPSTNAATYEETAARDHDDTIDGAVKAAVETNGSSTFEGLTDSSTADDIAAKLQAALDPGYTVAVDSQVTKGDADSNGFTPLTTTLTIQKGDKTTQYNITVKAKSDTKSYKNNASRADAVSKDVVKYLNDYKGFKATGEISSADVYSVVSAYLNEKTDKSDQDSVAGGGVKISYRSITVDNDNSTESTLTNHGTVSGKITFTFPAHKALKDTGKDSAINLEVAGKDDTVAVAAEDAVSVTVDFTSQRDFASESLTNADATTVATAIVAHPFQNGATADTIAARANAYIKQQAKTQAKWRGVTATVSGVVKQDPQAHGKGTSYGSFAAKLTLTKGSEVVSADISNTTAPNGLYVHSDEDKLTELDSAITSTASKFSTAKYQRANATQAVDAKNAAGDTNNFNSVEDAVTKVLEDAIDSKVDNVALDAASVGDGWSDKGISVEVKDTTDKSAPATMADWTRQDPPTAKGPQRIEAKVLYTPATVKTEGKAEVTVTSSVLNSEAYALGLLDGTYTNNTTGDDIDALTKTTTFTLTFSKLKATADTYLNFSKGSYTVTYNSDATNEKYNSFKLGNNAAGTGVNLNAVGTEVERTDVPYIQHDGNDELEYTSSNTDVAIVDNEGNVVLKGTGTAIITVTDKDNSNLSATITINSTDKFVFDDVQDPKAYYYEAVKAAYQATPQVTAGVSKNEFGVNEKVTRGQFVAWLYRAAGEPTVVTTNKFTDVASDAYYAKAVAWATKNGIAYGTSNTTFDPNGTVTREQAAAFLYRTYGNGEQYIAPANFFTDVNPSSYAYNAIVWAYRNRVTFGKSTTSFAPKDDVLRTDGITFVYRANGEKF